MSSKAAPKAARIRSKAVSAPRRAQKAMSREARMAYAEIEAGVKHLEESIGEIQRGCARRRRSSRQTRVRGFANCARMRARSWLS